MNTKYYLKRSELCYALMLPHIVLVCPIILVAVSRY